jgi:peptidoglycan/LPS O-acetylase OafA/YrhL
MRKSAAVDAIRFLAALCVVLHHLIGHPDRLGKLSVHVFGPGSHWLGELCAALWFGPAAVVVFFVVSGYCVHGPHAEEERLNVSAFLVRRYVRLGLPLVAILVVGAATGVSYSPYTSVIWSLVCELGYYTVYPVLRILWQRVGWASVISASYVIGYGIFALEPDAPLIGPMLAYLPCWLVGCWLVEQVSHGRRLSGNLLLARVAVIGVAVLVGFAHYVGFISLHWTLPAFGALIVPWLWLEVSNDVVPAVGVRGTLAHWGRWSYSLYLMHPAVILGVTPMLLSPHASRSTYAIVAVVLSLLLSFAFYKVVEHPSHRLARRLANAILADQTRKQDASIADRERAPPSGTASGPSPISLRSSRPTAVQSIGSTESQGRARNQS